MATVVPKSEVRHYQMYIDGRWTDAASGENPQRHLINIHRLKVRHA